MLIFAAIVAIFVYGMISAMLGTILPNLSERFHPLPRRMEPSPSCRRWG
jgi:type II secretory pathway component PulF